MTIKKMMMAAGAIDEPQVIAPSSNDWDYSFDGGGEWPAAGNTLGDHTIGGYIDNIGGDSALSSLITFDGDFEVEFTMVVENNTNFGVHAIDEDDTRTAAYVIGAGSMTNSFWFSEASNGLYSYGGTSESTGTDIADGSVVKMERVGSTIKVYDDGAVVHTFSGTYAGTVRFFLGADGTPFDTNIDNLLFTDTEKVQRDGMFDSANSSITIGDGFSSGRKHTALLFIPTRSGTITNVTIDAITINTAFDAHASLYNHDGTNPSSQIGSNSDTVALSSTGEKTFTFTSSTVVKKGTKYWMIVSDEGTAGSVTAGQYTTAQLPDGWGAGLSDTIGAITNNWNEGNAMEITIDTSDGEPTPDHEVLFQVQSNDTNGSTSFTDESQTGSAVSAVDGAHHDNGQAKFGTTSIYCDGTNDEITIADNINYSMSSDQAFTWEWWMYVNGTPANNTHCAGQGTDATANMAYWSRFNNGGTLTVASGNGSSARYITCTTNLSNAWHHIAYIHIAGKSYLCIDGTSEGSPIAHTDIVQNVAYPFTFGGGNNSASHVDAWFEGMRLSRTARYDPINGFTPPVARFPSS
jgi:hypothetical protein